MLVLPDKSKPEELSLAIKRLLTRGIVPRNIRLCEWLVNRAFLAGARKFQTVDYRTGMVDFTYENQYDNIEFRNDELLRDYQIEMGRFLGIDVRPSVTMLGWGLDRLRAASVGQVVLDSQVDETTLNRVRVPFLEQYLQLGFTGLMAGVKDAGVLSGQSVLEVVSPWEIIPIPYNAQSPQQAIGYIRVRWVPVEWMRRNTDYKDKIAKAAAKNKGKLGIREVPWDEVQSAAYDGNYDPTTASVLAMLGSAFQRSFADAYSAGDDPKLSKFKEGREIARVTEYWLKTDRGLVRRYGMMMGEVILEDQDYEDSSESVWMPMGLARYYGIGFYGRAFVEPLRPFVEQAEKYLRATFRNLRDLDAMGLLMIPNGLGIDDESFRLDEFPRKVYYEPDPLLPDRGIGQIGPKNIGTLPMQAVNIASSYMQKLAGQSPIFQGRSIGRVDSQAGMGLALETNNVAIEAPGQSIADAFTTVYSAILSASKQKLTRQVMLQVLSLDSNVVGVAMAPDGSVNLDKNPVPSPADVKINIKARTPPSPAQQLQELRMERQLGHITPLQYRLAVYRKGLPTEVCNEAEYQSWRKVRYNIRILFNDGETPNTELIAVDVMSDVVQVCMDELAAFMASPEYSLASPQVKDAFVALREQYEGMKGQWPGQMPYEDGLAAGSQAGPGQPPPGQMPGGM